MRPLSISSQPASLRTSFPGLESSFLLPFDNTNGSQVGVALVNGDTSAPAAITLAIWDSAWVRIGSEASDLPPGGHLSFMLAERHPATADKRRSP